ncbi:ATP-binding protein, partial [Paenibacillus graminis]
PGQRPAGGVSPDASGLEAGMKELRRLMDAWNAWRQRVEKLAAEREACRVELDSLSGQEHALAAELEQAEADFTALAGRYEEWLHERKLPDGLSPESLPDIFSMVEQGNELLRQEHKLAVRLGNLKSECIFFEREVSALMIEAGDGAIAEVGSGQNEGAGRDVGTSADAGHQNLSSDDPVNGLEHSAGAVQALRSSDGVAATDRSNMSNAPAAADHEHPFSGSKTTSVSATPLQQQFEAVGLSLLSWLELRKREWDLLQMELLRREGMNVRLLELQEELAVSSRELEELSRRSRELLHEGGAVDGEEFLRRSSAVQRRVELTKSIRQWELAMFGGWENQAAAELLTLLETHDAYTLAQERNAAEETAVSIEDDRNAMLQHRGKLLQEREYLLERGLEDSVLQQLEEQRAALRVIAGQYAVTALAAELMGRTRRIYEREKQPQVLLLASEYFAKLTEGEYRRVVMTLGNKELKAEHKNLGLLDSGLLSRGTAEQLYLAIRLALAETMSRQANLPLLFDDLFVNFDERRLHAALALLGELSANRQIIMMTCHRHVVEAAARIIPAAQVISV